MIQLLVGPYRSGKTSRLLRELVEHKREYPLDSCLILVPSQRYGSLLRERLIETISSQPNLKINEPLTPAPHTSDQFLNSTRGIFGVRISTIYDACEQVIRNAGIAPLILPHELCTDVIAQTLAKMQASGELSHLSSIASMRGTASSMHKLIDEFERAATTPSDVWRAVTTTASVESRYCELAAVYRQYWERLDELGATDQKRMAFLCRELLSGGHARSHSAATNDVRYLIVDGFDRISPLQAEVIHALSQHSMLTKISFDYLLPEDRPGHGSADDFATEQEDEYSWKDASYQHLQQRLQTNPERCNIADEENQPQIAGFRAIEKFFEAQEIARRCKEFLMASNGGKEAAGNASSVLVVARDVSAYAEPFRAAFTDAGIPFFVDESIAHSSLPLTRFLLKLFSLSLNDWPRRQLIDCLRSPFINLGGLGLNKTNVEMLDRKSLNAGILSGRTAWQNFLDKSFNEELAIKFDAVFNLIEPQQQSSITEYCRWIEDLLDLARKPANGRSADDLSATMTNPELEALASFRAALNTMMLKEKLFKRQSLPYAEFFAELQSAIEKSTLRRSPSSKNAVHICSAEHAPNRRFDFVMVAGSVEGEFPKRSGESGFLSAEERARWGGYGIDLKDPRQEPSFERALFKTLLERARHRICISAPVVDMNGDEVFPSFYLADGTVDLPSFDRIDVCSHSLRKPASPRESVFSWLWHRAGIEVADNMQEQSEIARYWQKTRNAAFGAWSRHNTVRTNAYNGCLTDLTESDWLQVKAPAALSPSALNNYGQCPFKFWLTNLLSVQPRREPDTGLTAQFKGSLFHRTLEIYYSRMVQIPPEQRDAIRESLLAQSLSAAVEELEKEPLFHPSPYWKNEQKELLFRLNRFVEFDESRLQRDKDLPQPALFEARFGMPGESYPPLKIHTDAGTVSVRGVIDRIDISQDAVEQGPNPQPAPPVPVIDYKTGSTPITADDIAAFAQIQLPLYAMAVEQSILPGTVVTTGQYLSVNAAKSIGSVSFAHERWRELTKNTKQRIKHTMENIVKGDFSVRPYASKACVTCDHASVCRVGDMKLLENMGE